MPRHGVRVVLGLAGCITILLGARCGKGYFTEPQIPGVGLQVPLVQVDGNSVPTIIAASASDQTTVVSGNATLGEAIVTGQYTISLRHTMEGTAKTSTVTGTTLLDWSESSVAATVDLGGGLGTHTFTFAR